LASNRRSLRYDSKGNWSQEGRGEDFKKKEERPQKQSAKSKILAVSGGGDLVIGPKHRKKDGGLTSTCNFITAYGAIGQTEGEDLRGRARREVFINRRIRNNGADEWKRHRLAKSLRGRTGPGERV